MISPKTFQVVQTLYNKTMDGSICWGETIEDGEYQLSYPTFTVKIFQRINQFSTEPDTLDIVIQFFNENAILVEEITDVDISQASLLPGSSFSYMNELYKKARGQALGADKVMDDILGQLETKPAAEDEIPF